jgi:hypothetical protein
LKDKESQTPKKLLAVLYNLVGFGSCRFFIIYPLPAEKAFQIYAITAYALANAENLGSVALAE